METCLVAPKLIFLKTKQELKNKQTKRKAMVACMFSIPLTGTRFNFSDINTLPQPREMKSLEAKVSSARPFRISTVPEEFKTE